MPEFSPYIEPDAPAAAGQSVFGKPVSVGTALEGMISSNVALNQQLTKTLKDLSVVARRNTMNSGDQRNSGSTVVPAALDKRVSSFGLPSSYQTDGVVPVLIVGTSSALPVIGSGGGVVGGGTSGPTGSTVVPPPSDSWSKKAPPGGYPSTPGGGAPASTAPGKTTPPSSPDTTAQQAAKFYRSGHSFQGIAKAIQSSDSPFAKRLMGTEVGGGFVGDLAKGTGIGAATTGALSDSALGSSAAAIGGVALAAGIGDWLLNSGGNWLAGQRAQNATFQSMLGGSNLAAVSQRAQQTEFQYNTWGDLSTSQADKAFQGVTGLGLKGGARNNALNFIVQQYNDLGMSVQDSMGVVTTAVQNGVKNFDALAFSLNQVTQSATSASINADVARQNFVSMYTGLLSVGINPIASNLVAAANQNSLNRLGQAGVGVSIGTSSNAIYAEAEMLHKRAGQLEANPILAAHGQDLYLKQMLGGQQALFSPSLLAKIAKAKNFNLSETSGLGAEIMNQTPVDIGMMATDLTNAGITFNPNDPNSILSVFTNYALDRNPNTNGSITKAVAEARKKQLAAKKVGMGYGNRIERWYGAIPGVGHPLGAALGGLFDWGDTLVKGSPTQNSIPQLIGNYSGGLDPIRHNIASIADDLFGGLFGSSGGGGSTSKKMELVQNQRTGQVQMIDLTPEAKKYLRLINRVGRDAPRLPDVGYPPGM